MREMLKETETEETIDFFVLFLSLVAFQLGRALGPFLAMSMYYRVEIALRCCQMKYDCKTLRLVIY